MGEAKRKRDAAGSSAAPGLAKEVLERLTRELIANGLLIEAGFASLRARAIPPDAPPEQLREMRLAFFAGAQHLFGSIMGGGVLDDDAEPTQADMARMSAIAAELQTFINEFQLRELPAEGRA